MAELIDKPTMLDWVQKQVEAVTKKQVAVSDGIFTREVLTTMQRNLSAFENAINVMTTTTEAEIRAKAVDEFAEYLKEIESISAKCTRSQSDGYSQIMRVCEAIAEQLKEE